MTKKNNYDNDKQEHGQVQGNEQGHEHEQGHKHGQGLTLTHLHSVIKHYNI